MCLCGYGWYFNSFVDDGFIDLPPIIRIWQFVWIFLLFVLFVVASCLLWVSFTVGVFTFCCWFAFGFPFVFWFSGFVDLVLAFDLGFCGFWLLFSGLFCFIWFALFGCWFGYWFALLDLFALFGWFVRLFV